MRDQPKAAPSRGQLLGPTCVVGAARERRGVRGRELDRLDLALAQGVEQALVEARLDRVVDLALALRRAHEQRLARRDATRHEQQGDRREQAAQAGH